MGWNTTVVVLNDALDQIKNDPEFGKKLASKISSIEVERHICERQGRTFYGVDVSAGNHCNAATVIETHHADMNKVILVGGNMGEDLGTVWMDGHRLDPETNQPEPDELRLARALVEKHGYHIRKNPSK